MFNKFLNSLKRPDNIKLIEAIQKGYNAIFESPVAEVRINNEIKFIDFHVEDYYQIDGNEKTVEYVKYLLKQLENNETIEINEKFIRHEEIPALEKGQYKFSPEDFEAVTNFLNRVKTRIEDEIEHLVPA